MADALAVVILIEQAIRVNDGFVGIGADRRPGQIGQMGDAAGNTRHWIDLAAFVLVRDVVLRIARDHAERPRCILDGHRQSIRLLRMRLLANRDRGCVVVGHEQGLQSGTRGRTQCQEQQEARRKEVGSESMEEHVDSSLQAHREGMRAGFLLSKSRENARIPPAHRPCREGAWPRRAAALSPAPTTWTRRPRARHISTSFPRGPALGWRLPRSAPRERPP